MSEATNPRATLLTKLSQVMASVQRIPKNGYNDFHKYHYVKEDDLVEAIRGLLVAEGVAFSASALERNRDGEITSVKMEFTLSDVETGESITSVWWGDGQDKGDKGVYKAYTGAEKYFLMKTFLIPTGDDPDQTDKNKTRRPKDSQRPDSPITSKLVIQIASDKGVKDIEDVKRLASVACNRKVTELTDLSVDELQETADRISNTHPKTIQLTLERMKNRAKS